MKERDGGTEHGKKERGDDDGEGSQRSEDSKDGHKRGTSSGEEQGQMIFLSLVVMVFILRGIK